MKQFSNILNKYVERSIEYRSRLMQKSNMPMLSLKQFYYLDAIKKIKDPTLTSVAGYLGITKASASEIISKLMEMGYLKKIKDEQDRRSSIIKLTKSGNEVSRISHDANELMIKELEGKLTEREMNSLFRILKKGL